MIIGGLHAWRKDSAWVVETFGRIREERVVSLILVMSATSKARKQALAWLVAHAEYARPIVAGLAKEGGPKAEWAAAALAKME